MIKEKIYDYFKLKEQIKEIPEKVTFAPSYFSDCKRK